MHLKADIVDETGRTTPACLAVPSAGPAAELVDLPYRDCVGILLLNRFGLVWTGMRRPKWAAAGEGPYWQLPQGGILRDEEPAAAALRELAEETSVRSVQIVAEIPEWLHVDLPPELIGVALKGRFRGQRLKWFAMRLEGPDSDVDIRPRQGRKAEFTAWRWARIDEVPAEVAPFRRALYDTVVTRFAGLARAA